MSDPLLPHLLDILAQPASEGLILAGGYGIRLKLNHFVTRGEQTLLSWNQMPPARATQDLDFFLKMDFFVTPDKGVALRKTLTDLGYHEAQPKFLQFTKPFPSSALNIKIDFLARSPQGHEMQRLNVDPVRVGARPGIGIHGRHTPEAFAVEEKVISLLLPDHNAHVSVPHPYAWLNMKVKASHDWLLQEWGTHARPKADRIKHLADVYRLVGALTQAEPTEAVELAKNYKNHPTAEELRVCARQLFAEETGRGTLALQQTAGINIAYKPFWEGLSQALGL